MNCQDFETVIIEIARARLLDAVARERGLEHVETCAHCAMLLAEERALSEKLRAFSGAVRAEEIPTQIEAALLTAFHQRTAVASPSNGRRWLLAVAAVLLLAIGLSLAGWLSLSSSQKSMTGGSTAKVSVPAPTNVLETSGKSEQAGLQTARLAVDVKLVKRQKRLVQPSVSQRFAEAGQPRELVTQFFPLIQGSELIPLEGGQIVRVRMPRSNLIPLGINFNQERANDTIQADVLVSNDGLARAIRLVY